MDKFRKRSKAYPIVAFLLVLVMMGSILSPVMAAFEGAPDLGAGTPVIAGKPQESNETADLITSLSLEIQKSIVTSTGVYIAGFSQDAAGNYYVMGTATGKVGAEDPASSVGRIFLSKFDQDLNEIATKVIFQSQVENIYHNGNPSTGYVFATSNSTYEIYDQSLYNGAMTVGPDGNIYIALRNKATKTLLYDDYYEIYDEFYNECTCLYGGMGCDETECDWGDTDDCSVCNAYREFTANFVPGASTDLLLCKIDSGLNLQKQLVIGNDRRSGVSSNDSLPRAYDIGFDSVGNIYLTGTTGGNILTSPVYGFNEFVSNNSSPYVDDDKLDMGRGFLVKVDSGMNSVVKSTYFAGPSAFNAGRSSKAAVTCVAVDGDYVYVAGQDCGGKLPATTGAASGWMKSSSSTSQGGFIAKLDKDTFEAERTTYIGGSGSELVNNLVVNTDAVYVAGTTTSTNMKTGTDVFKTSKTGSYQEIYLARLAKDLSADGYLATYYGSPSSRNDQFGLDIDAAGNLYITGETYSASSFPVQDGSSAGRIYVSKLSSDFSTNMASTIIHPASTTSGTQGRGVKVLADGNVIVVGQDGAATAFIEKYSPSFAHSKINTIAENRGYQSANQYLSAGEELIININFATYVTVTGTPTLKLNAVDAGGQNVKAAYSSGSNTKQLKFTYTVQAGDTTNGSLLNCFDSNALELNGGSILPAAGGTAGDIDLTTPITNYDLPYSKIYINTVPAKVKSVTSSAADGTYSNGVVIPITVEFDGEIASVTGMPTLELNSGGTAAYNSIYTANKKQLIFNYTVGETDSAEKLDYLAADALKLNGAVIKDNYQNTLTAPDVLLPAPGGTGSLAAGKNIVVDSDVPSIVSVTTTKEAGYYSVGAEIPILIKFSKNIDKTGTVKINLNTAGSIAHTGDVANSDTLTFIYIVGAGQNANPLNISSGSSLLLDPGASITENGGTKSAALSLPQSNQAGDLGTQGIVIDTTAPKVSYIYKEPSTNYFKAGDIVWLRANMSKAVKVNVGDGPAPTVEINYKGSGDTYKVMTFDRVSADGLNLYFGYTVADGDYLKANQGLQMPTAAQWKITFQPGQITDLAGNDLNPATLNYSTFASMSPFYSVCFDTEAPAFSSATPITAAYNDSQAKVDISWEKPADTGSGLSRVYIGRKESNKSDDSIMALTDFAGSANTTSYSDTTIVAGKTYTYIVYAADNAGNISEYKYSTEIEIPGGQSAGTPPTWADTGVLTVERLSSTSAKLSWDLVQAVDSSDVGIAAFKVYRKSGEDWEYIGQTDDGTTDWYTVQGIGADEYTFKVTIVDNSALESENAISETVAAIDWLFAIKDSHNNLLKYIYMIDLTGDKLNNQHYSGTNNSGNTNWYGVTGVYVADLLKMAEVTDYSSVAFHAMGVSPLSMTKDFAEGDRYYFGKDDITDKKLVKPMISLHYTEYALSGAMEYQLPKFPGEEGIPAEVLTYGDTRLFFGQSQYLERNRSYFLKEVYVLEVDMDSTEPVGNPILSGVEAGTDTIRVGDPIPDTFPAVSVLTATDANGIPISQENITRTVTAMDNPAHDPNVLSSDVAGTYTVTYRVVDTYGNETVVARILVVLPAEPGTDKPTLNGVTSGMTIIYVGDPLSADFPAVSELTATDFTGAAIDPANITRTVAAANNPAHDPNTLSTEVADTYTVTYRVVDDYGNETVVVRTLVVLEQRGDYSVVIPASPDYTVDLDSGIPQMVICTTAGQVEVKCIIKVGDKEYPGDKSVLLVHFRGNKMISIMTINDEEFAVDTEIGGTVTNVQTGDAILVFIVDQLTNKAGDPTHILYK